MKVLKKMKNGNCNIEYYDKITRQKVVLKNVSSEVVKTLKQSKKEEDEYRKFAKKHLVSLDELLENNIEIADEDIEALVYDDEISPDNKEFMYKVFKALRTLTPRQRQVFRMSHYESLDNKTIATKLNLSQPRVSQILNEAREKLQNFLKK